MWKIPKSAMANRYAAALSALTLIALLLSAIALTLREYRWMEFLLGVLAAAVIASASRSANSAWVIARRTSQLAAARSKLAAESRLRLRAEKALARAGDNANFVDDTLPAMLAYVDLSGHVRYHNRAYARWVGLSSESINGRLLHEVLGLATYAEIEGRMQAALEGVEARYERVQTMPSGETYRLFVQYIPHFDEHGDVVGIFAILTDITRAGDLPVSPPAAQDAPVEPSFKAAGRLIAALERDEFCLYRQEISALGEGGGAPFYEVQLRQKEEEARQMPPGAFLAIAEEQGMLTDLDKWVVRHVLEGSRDASPGKQAVYVINVSGDSVRDPGFRQYVRAQLKATGLPGSVLCFESAETDVVASPEEFSTFITDLGECGCQFAVSGFGHRATSFQLLAKLRVNYLKLDGGIILNMLRSRKDLAKVKAINAAAHSAGMRTVADCVENERTRRALQKLDIDYAQGQVIGKACELVHPGADVALDCVLPR